MKFRVFIFSCLFISTIGLSDAEAIRLSKVGNVVSNNTKNSLDISKTIEDSMQKAVKVGTDEFNKNIKSVVDDVRKDINSVVSDAKKEISSVQGTIKEVKSTVYSVKASFDKIILLLKVLIGLIGVLIAMLALSFLNKIIKILKLTRSVVSLAKEGKTKSK